MILETFVNIITVHLLNILVINKINMHLVNTRMLLLLFIIIYTLCARENLKLHFVNIYNARSGMQSISA